MRRFFPLVLMLLLVLRGLLGTAMAAGMVSALPAGGLEQQANLVQPRLHPSHCADSAAAVVPGLVVTAEHSTDSQNDGMHAQCPDQATGPCGTSAHTHGPLCSACEICHSAMLVPPQLNTPPHPGAAEVRPGATAPFASAAAALAIKPPIA